MHVFKFFSMLLLLTAVTVCNTGCKKKQPQPKKVINGTKQIITAPEGASIFYGDKELGKTPYTITAKPNFYTVKLVKEGYRSQFVSFQIKKGKNPASTISLEPHTSSVMIDSRPNKASVIYNGKRIGETPHIISELSIGSHSVRLEKSGFSPKDVVFKITSERPQRIMTSLDSNIGKIIVYSSPSGAKISINGKTIGVTPFTGEYPAGQYQLSLQAPNHREYTTTVAIQKGRTARISPRLQLLPGSFEIQSTPSKAKVFWDGKYIGQTPIVIKDQIANVNHSIRLTLSGYAEISQNLKTTPGKLEVKTFNFKRNRGDLELVINPPGVTVYLNNKKIGVTEKSENARVSKVLSVKNLKPGTYTVYYTHRRATPNGKTKKVEIKAGETTRPAPLSLWVPNAEVVYQDDSTESVVIISQSNDGIFVETQDNIRYTILNSKIKKINHFKADQ